MRTMQTDYAHSPGALREVCYEWESGIWTLVAARISEKGKLSSSKPAAREAVLVSFVGRL